MFAFPSMLLGSGIDPLYWSVALLLHGDGANNSTTFTDDGPDHITVTPYGSAKISTTQSKFGGSAMYFGTTSGDYVSVAQPSAPNIGAGDFCLEAWIRLTAYAATFCDIVSTLTSNTDTTAGHFAFGVRSTGALELYSGATVLAAGSVSTGAWHHVAATRASGQLRLFIDGTQVGSTTAFSASLTQLLTTIGGRVATTFNVNGYLDDVRVTVGAPRYTANFTPATAAFPNG